MHFKIQNAILLHTSLIISNYVNMLQLGYDSNRLQANITVLNGVLIRASCDYMYSKTHCTQSKYNDQNAYEYQDTESKILIPPKWCPNTSFKSSLNKWSKGSKLWY